MTKKERPQIIQDSSQELIIKGCWGGRQLGDAEKLLKAQVSKIKSPQRIVVNRSYVDTNGARLIQTLIQKYGCELVASKEQEKIFSTLPAGLPKNINQEKQPSLLVNFFEKIGSAAIEAGSLTIKLFDFFGHIVIMLGRKYRQLRWISIGRHIEDFGVQAIPIVSLISFLIGMVLSYQGINQLNRFGAELFAVDFLGIGILREIGVLLTSIVIAGRSGSAIAAEIGTMNLNQEIDAIRIMGLGPLEVLVIPRLMGLLITLPCLVFLSDIMGIIGGMCMSNVAIDLSFGQFFTQLQKALTPTHFWVGMSKAPLFALIISIVSCFRGFQVKGSAEHVGQMTTRAVVESIFLIIVCDAFLSIMYAYMGI